MSNFEFWAATAFFASAWADQEEESGNAKGGEILNRMPGEIDPAAVIAARTLKIDIERANGKTIEELHNFIIRHHSGDRPPEMQYFGHYAAMQAMGHGVGLLDAFGSLVALSIKIPYVEFGAHSLEKDYFS